LAIERVQSLAADDLVFEIAADRTGLLQPRNIVAALLRSVE
jgi:hypothetical protein